MHQHQGYKQALTKDTCVLAFSVSLGYPYNAENRLKRTFCALNESQGCLYQAYPL